MTTQPNKTITRRKSKFGTIRKLLILFLFFSFVACLFSLLFYIPTRAVRLYGPPAPWLSLPQRVQYSALLLWYNGLLTQPLDVNGTEQSFTIEIGESVDSVANHLEGVGL
ncbi:MAG TPA: hypothetical protein VFY83_05575, partial [Anaerolineales bacterium]|nr:hypothetical protein [Anaerolineales bacterium]